jgi:hypothetical protein
MARAGVLAAACLVAGTSTASAQSPGNLSTYAIEGVALGARIPFDSSAYREYKCSPSDQFEAFTWCQKTRQERRSSSEATYSVLHSLDGNIVYINRYQAPTFFAPMKPSRIFSPTRENSVSRHRRYACRLDSELTEFLPHGERLYWNRSISIIDGHSLKGDVSARDITSILSVTLLAPLKRAFRYTG